MKSLTKLARRRALILAVLPLIGLLAGSLTGCIVTPPELNSNSTVPNQSQVAVLPGLTPTLSPTVTPRPTVSPVPTETPIPTITPTPTETVVPTPAGLENGFLARDGKVFEWKGEQLIPLDMPAELKTLISGPAISYVDTDLQTILAQGTMAIVAGRPVLQIMVNGQATAVAEYVNDVWRTADFQILAGSEQLKTVQASIKELNVPVQKIQNARDGTIIIFAGAPMVGVAVVGGRLETMYMVGAGDKMAVASPSEIVFGENKLSPGGKTYLSGDAWATKTGIAVPVDLLTTVRMLRMFELGGDGNLFNFVDVFNPSGSVDLSALYKQVMANLIPVTSLDDLGAQWARVEITDHVGDPGTIGFLGVQDDRKPWRNETATPTPTRTP